MGRYHSPQNLGFIIAPISEGKSQPVGSRVQPSVPFTLDVESPVDDDKMGSDYELQTFQVLTT